MNEIILHVSSGQGPEECRWVVAQLARVFVSEGAREGLDCTLVEAVSGNPASLLLRVTGEGSDAFAKERTGTVLWIGKSPFRPHHKRRNWFVGVRVPPPVEEIAGFRDEDVDYQSMRASGPGGQHVNKTDSAVRAVHRPTGLTAVAQEQRSQHANRKLAQLKLAMLIAERNENEVANGRREDWSRNHQIERGNPVRVYAGSAFKLKAGR
jgi:peptide chain release factor